MSVRVEPGTLRNNNELLSGVVCTSGWGIPQEVRTVAPVACLYTLVV